MAAMAVSEGDDAKQGADQDADAKDAVGGTPSSPSKETESDSKSAKDVDVDDADIKDSADAKRGELEEDDAKGEGVGDKSVADEK